MQIRRYFRRHSRENETRSGAHFRVHTEDCSPVRNGIRGILHEYHDVFTGNIIAQTHLPAQHEADQVAGDHQRDGKIG